jgi:GDP-L-fucose synthase
MRVLERDYPPDCVLGVSNREYDLMDPAVARLMFDELKPAVVVHLAGCCGGIAANREFPADFYYRNSILTAQVLEAAARHGVRKVIYPIGSCSYPAGARSPIGEDQLWEGRPHSDTEAYSATKRLATIAAEAYRRQYGMQVVVLTLGNMYGEYATFHLRGAQVIAAMIRRFFEAQRNRAKVTLWGTGSPVRDFVYAGDVAALIPWFLENYAAENGPINVSSGAAVTMKELAGLIREIAGFSGEVEWDIAKPDGQAIKLYDIRKLRSYGLSCPTTLRDGIARTFAWFAKNCDSGGEGLRL